MFCGLLHLELAKHQLSVANTANMSSQFELAQNPTEPISSVTFSPRTPTRLLVSSWDRHVYLYDTHGEPGGKLLQKFEHRAPVLDVCFGRDDNEAFSAGLDWEVRRYNGPKPHIYPSPELTRSLESTSPPARKQSYPHTPKASATLSTPPRTTSSSPHHGTRHCTCTTSLPPATSPSSTSPRNPSRSVPPPQNSSSQWPVAQSTSTN